MRSGGDGRRRVGRHLRLQLHLSFELLRIHLRWNRASSYIFAFSSGRSKQRRGQSLCVGIRRTEEGIEGRRGFRSAFFKFLRAQIMNVLAIQRPIVGWIQHTVRHPSLQLC